MIPKGLVKVRKSELPRLAREMFMQDLLVIPLSTSSFTPSPNPIRLWAEDEEWIGVPRAYYWDVVKKRFDPEVEFNYSVGQSGLRDSKGAEFRPGQEQVVNGAVEELRSKPFSGVITEVVTGGGKSFIGASIARQLGMKTLVVVHTSVLMDQWIASLKNFFPEWSIGKIQANTMDVGNNDICVGMLQSLSMKDDYPESLYSEFGTIIVDEIHVAAAAEFHQLFKRFAPKHVIGLSGTLKRADKAEKVFHAFTGKIIKGDGLVKVLDPTIYFIDTKYVVQMASHGEFDREKHQFLSEITDSPARNAVIINNAVKAALAGRHVIILSERVKHVEDLYVELNEILSSKGIKVGMMVGKSNKEEREYSQTAQVLVATVQLLAVGFDNSRLDTLILATPVQNMYQAVGRILRTHPDKKPPMVLDLVDSGNRMSIVYALSRRKKYLAKQGWKVVGDQFILNKIPKKGNVK